MSGGVEASTRNRLRPAKRLARQILLPPLVISLSLVWLLFSFAMTQGEHVRADNPLAHSTADSMRAAITGQLSIDLEGTPTAADVRRARRPLSERKRLLAAHPYFRLYKLAKRRFDVSWYLVAAVHYQETGFGKAPASFAKTREWQRHRDAVRTVARPARYPNRSTRHPSVRDDFDVVAAIGAGLHADGARGLGESAQRALAARYGTDPQGRLAAAMVIERARAWRLLGTLPLPGRGELATPVRGVVGGCGYFGCPRPGHLHNGVDFVAPANAPIHAAAEGRVALVESSGASGGYGNFICIQHRPHLATCYAHLSAFAAELGVGTAVRRGQIIGVVGSTGSSTAPHLHFEVRRGPAKCSTCAVDPLPMLSGEVPSAALPDLVGLAGVVTRVSSAAPFSAPEPAPSVVEPRGETLSGGGPADARAGAPQRERARSDGSREGGGSSVNDPPVVRTIPAPAAAPAPEPLIPPGPSDTATDGVAPPAPPEEPPPPQPAASAPPPPPAVPLIPALRPQPRAR